jgi:hypothetical protein
MKMQKSKITYSIKNMEFIEAAKEELSHELSLILKRLRGSSRSVVKSALREFRDLTNSINTSLMRSYEADQLIQERKEKWVQQRFYL